MLMIVRTDDASIVCIDIHRYIVMVLKNVLVLVVVCHFC